MTSSCLFENSFDEKFKFGVRILLRITRPEDVVKVEVEIHPPTIRWKGSDDQLVRDFSGVPGSSILT